MLLLLVAASVVVGQREASWDALTAGLRHGDVHEVQVEDAIGGPDGIPRGAAGSTVVRLVWRDGPFTRSTEIRQVVGDPGADGFTPGAPSTMPTVQGRVDEALRAANPGVAITWREQGSHGWVNFAGARLPGTGWVLILIPVGLEALLLLLSDANPRYATKWAWAWLMLLTSGLGMAAYLLVGAGRPRPGERRITGGWGLLLAMVLSSAV